MGVGAFREGAFDLVVVADFALTNPAREQWLDSLRRAADRFYDATEGQLRLGRIFITDDSWGLGQAEIVLHGFVATSYATLGDFGRFGAAIHLTDDLRNSSGVGIVHELGHHLWGLGDEYTGPVLLDDIDTEIDPPTRPNPDHDPNDPNSPAAIVDTSIIPIVQSPHAAADIEYTEAILAFGGMVERRIVQEHSPSQARVYNFYGQPPQTANPPRVAYQPTQGVGCGEPFQTGASFCLMEARDPDVGVTEFCVAGNHDPDGDTAHTARYGGLSCWEVIRDVMAERFAYVLTVPDPGQPGPTPAPEPPQIFELAKELRLVLVVDRSGSMSDDAKIEGARWGVEYWMRFGQTSAEDWLSVVWYNHQITTALPLSRLGDLSEEEIDAKIAEVNALQPTGATNIRDGLYAALDAIQSRDERAAIQVAVLLTDGVHNSPYGSSATEVIPSFNEAGVQIFGLGLGGPDNVDFELLEELARRTSGRAYGNAIGLDENPQQASVAIDLATLNGQLRGGLIVLEDSEIAESPPAGAVDRRFAEWLRAGKQPPLKDVLEVLGIDDLAKIAALPAALEARFAIQPVLVEAGAQRASFSLFHPEKLPLWLYLVDPTGAHVDLAAPDVAHVRTTSPFTFAIVRQPKPGRWTMVAVRPTPGPGFRFRWFAGGENRHLCVTGGAQEVVPLGTAGRLHARALWGDPLSNLVVRAEITGPDGSHHQVELSDAAPHEPNSGDYQGFFTPTVPGRHFGEIRIANRGQAILAGGLYRLRHAKPDPDPKKGASISLAVKAPRFVRTVPFHFDAGKRPEPRDAERERGVVGRFQPVRARRTKLTPLPPPKRSRAE